MNSKAMKIWTFFLMKLFRNIIFAWQLQVVEMENVNLPHLLNRATNRIHFRNGKIVYGARKQLQRILSRARRNRKGNGYYFCGGKIKYEVFFITSARRSFQ